MAQDDKKIKVLISTKENLGLDKYKSMGFPFDWKVVKLLMQYKGSEITKNNFSEYLEKLKFKDDAEDEQSIVTNCWSVRENDFKETDLYKYILDNPDEYSKFINEFKLTIFVRSRFLQNIDGTVFIVPTLYDSYNQDNIEYVNGLIRCLKIGDEGNENGNDKEDWYLLLHDKDLLEGDGRPNSKVTDKDTQYGEFNKELQNLVTQNKVFVFQHDDSKDYYYNQIVNKLGELTSEKIVELLNGVAKNITFSKKLMGKMKKNDMRSECGSSEVYDFSKPFLEL